MKRAVRFTAAALGAVLALAPVPAACAGEEPTAKEEVVYINLDSAGDVDTVEVVNIFQLDQPGQIVDYGGYESVRNMTGTEPVFFDGRTVTLEAGAGRVYCEGSLPGAEIPWDVSLGYAMDGTGYTAEQIAGMSGALEIRLRVKENPRCRGDFFDTYALQISLTLDGDMCQDIQADGATMANVGRDKQLNYTVLPGRGADIVVKAQVTGFAMDAIAINGIPLSLDVEVDDAALLAKVTDLTDAIAQLDEGAGALNDGASELTAGVDEAAQGASALYSGASSLYSGAGSLQSGGASVQSGAYTVSTGAAQVSAGAQALLEGAKQMQAGLNTLNESSSQLTDGSSAILTALTEVQTAVDGAELTDADLAGITGALSAIQSGVDTLTGDLGLATASVQVLGMIQGSYVALADRLEGAITALETAADPSAPPDTGELWAVCYDLRAANESFASSLASLAGLSETADRLTADLNTVSTVVASLSQLVPQLPDALGQLQTGVDDLTAQYAALDAGIKAYTGGVAQACTSCGQLVSGASDLAAGTASLASGAGTLASGAATLAGGIGQVYDAAGALAEGAGALDSGMGELAEGVSALDEGAGQMKEGTAALAEGTDGMDGVIQGQVDGLLESVTGGASEPQSFVSPENTNVKAVQFVIRTPAVQPPEPAAPEPTPEAETSFLDKLIALF